MRADYAKGIIYYYDSRLRIEPEAEESHIVTFIINDDSLDRDEYVRKIMPILQEILPANTVGEWVLSPVYNVGLVWHPPTQTFEKLHNTGLWRIDAQLIATKADPI